MKKYKCPYCGKEFQKEFDYLYKYKRDAFNNYMAHVKGCGI